MEGLAISRLVTGVRLERLPLRMVTTWVWNGEFGEDADKEKVFHVRHRGDVRGGGICFR
jgi:hypothetical protein